MYGALPPEINSGRMYCGPGAMSMLVAADAWESLATDLSYTALSYESVICELISGPWLGASATTMAAAAAPYAGWLHATAAQARQAASQAAAAAAAYQTAHAMTVPPALVAANRAELTTLVATNILGQNSAAIGAIEIQYAEMWAQDAIAMYVYAAASAAATTMTPFTQPPQTAGSTGLAVQAAAVVDAAGASSAAHVAQTLQQLVQKVPSVLSMLTGGSPLPSWLSVPNLDSLMDLIARPVFLSASLSSTLIGLSAVLKPAASAAQALGSSAASSLASTARALGSAPLGTVSAGLGRAAPIGPLSVPPSWAMSPTGGGAATALPAGTAASSVGPLAGDTPAVLGGMPTTPSTGRAQTVSAMATNRGITPLRILPQVI